MLVYACTFDTVFRMFAFTMPYAFWIWRVSYDQMNVNSIPFLLLIDWIFYKASSFASRFMWKHTPVLVLGATHLIHFLLLSRMQIILQSSLLVLLSSLTSTKGMRTMVSLDFRSNAISAWMGRSLLQALRMALFTFTITGPPNL